jgi:hypothetical protein
LILHRYAVGARLNALAPTQELVDSYLMANGKKPTAMQAADTMKITHT